MSNSFLLVTLLLTNFSFVCMFGLLVWFRFKTWGKYDSLKSFNESKHGICSLGIYHDLDDSIRLSFDGTFVGTFDGDFDRAFARTL